MVDQTVGHFKILSKLGQGGMGAVYKTRDMSLDRLVALKVLPPAHLADPEHRQRLLQEARSASALNHPNIVVTYEIGSADGIDYIVMEYLEGRNLSACIGRTGLPVAVAVRYAIQITDALAAAHAAGLILRDLKPSNVMVGPNGVVKILDFGIAKHIQRKDEVETITLDLVQTKPGMMVGSAPYMSPEQAEGKDLDARSDIFSFGVVLYEMVTGKRAFQRDSTIATLSSVLYEQPRPAREFSAELPPELDHLVERCLRKDRERRPQSMADVKAILMDIADAPTTSSQTIPAIPGKRMRLRWPLLAIALLAGLAAAFWVGGHGPGSAEPSAPVPITGSLGRELDATFSPDGNEVAYPWNGGGDNLDIYIKLIGSGAPLRLTRDPASDFSPAWSPDGRFIAFLRALDSNKVALMIVPRLGGAERRIAEFLRVPQIGEMHTIAWSADGGSLIAPVRQNGSSAASLYAIPVAGGEMRRLTTPPAWATVGDFQPALSPDGRSLAFTRRSETVTEIDTLSLGSNLQALKETRQRTFKGQDNTSPAWTADGRELVFATISVSGAGMLWRVRVNAGERPEDHPRLVSEGGTSVAISRQGTRLAFTRHVLEEHIWRLGPEKHTAAPFLTSTRRDWEPHFSPDGRKIVFSSDRAGSMQVWLTDADGSNPGQLTSMPATVTGGARFSPDGERIAFISNVEGQLEIYSMNATGAGIQRLTNNPAHDSAASWSRDGNWIYFASDRSGDYQVWKMRADGSTPQQVTKTGGFAALESPDGQWLYYTKRDSRDGVWKMPIGGGEGTHVIPSLWRWGSFEMANPGIYFIPAEGNAIQFFSFATGRIEAISQLTHAVAFGLTATADGRTILYPQVDTDRSELLLIDNFQ